VSTVEHLLATLYALGVDNARIEVEGPELPVLDGSAGVWTERVLAAGGRRPKTPRSPSCASPGLCRSPMGIAR
jgi:UDP-3-O-[3-hydroxymyristoyl] N-acetylglucosamine deacetylase